MQIQAIMTRACNFVQSSLYTEDGQLSSLRGKGHVRTQSCALTPCHLSSKNWTNFTALREICQPTMLKIKMTLKFWWASQHSIHRVQLAHTFTSHHFYSLNEHACQISLKVQVTKTIQMPCFWSLSQARTLPLPPWMEAMSLLPPTTSQTRRKFSYAPYAQH